MKIRLLLLLAVLGVVLVVTLTKDETPTVAGTDGGDDDGPITEGGAPTVDQKKTLMEIDVPGENPAVTPDIQVQVRPDDSSGQNRLYYTITEKHGFFVETFRLRFWYSPSRYQEKNDEVSVMIFLVNHFLKANDTFEGYTQLTPVEMEIINRQMGTGDNWRAEVLHYGRWRDKNPAADWPGYQLKKPTG